MKSRTETNLDNNRQFNGISNTTLLVFVILTVITIIWALSLRRRDIPTAAAPPAAVAETPRPAAPPPPPVNAATKLAENWGISVAGVRLFAAGNMVDFRYKILDPAKATTLTKQDDEHAYFLDEASGQKIRIANVDRGGTMYHYTNNLPNGRTFSLQFPNPGKLLQTGSKVTLVMGDFKAENLTVE